MQAHVISRLGHMSTACYTLLLINSTEILIHCVSLVQYVLTTAFSCIAFSSQEYIFFHENSKRNVSDDVERHSYMILPFLCVYQIFTSVCLLA